MQAKPWKLKCFSEIEVSAPRDKICIHSTLENFETWANWIELVEVFRMKKKKSIWNCDGKLNWIIYMTISGWYSPSSRVQYPYKRERKFHWKFCNLHFDTCYAFKSVSTTSTSKWKSFLSRWRKNIHKLNEKIFKILIENGNWCYFLDIWVTQMRNDRASEGDRCKPLSSHLLKQHNRGDLVWPCSILMISWQIVVVDAQLFIILQYCGFQCLVW